jgi:uncharacterized membrane protein YjgN (DUF898 family)
MCYVITLTPEILARVKDTTQSKAYCGACVGFLGLLVAIILLTINAVITTQLSYNTDHNTAVVLLQVYGLIILYFLLLFAAVAVIDPMYHAVFDEFPTRYKRTSNQEEEEDISSVETNEY